MVYRIYRSKDGFIDIEAPCPSIALQQARECKFIFRFYLDICSQNKKI